MGERRGVRLNVQEKTEMKEEEQIEVGDWKGN